MQIQKRNKHVYKNYFLKKRTLFDVKEIFKTKPVM